VLHLSAYTNLSFYRLQFLTTTANNWEDDAVATVAGVSTVVDEIRTLMPSSRVLLLSLLPRADDARLGRLVKDVNTHLARLDDTAMNGGLITFLDVHDKMLVDGAVTKKLFVDSLHRR
jgi:beta-glucosidase